MITGNRGEWSEFYAFLKLIVDKKLDAAGPGFEKLSGIFYPIINITRIETDGIKSYELKGDQIAISVDGGKISLVKTDDLKDSIREIFKNIKESSGATFSIPIAEGPMKKFQVSQLNAASKLKEDLILLVHDMRTGTEVSSGFSVKSFVGNAATLLNASTATNFIYEVNGFSDSDIDPVNAIDTSSKIRDRLKEIVLRGGSLNYLKMESPVFQKNLRKCDVVMPEILAHILLSFYQSKGTSLAELVDSAVIDGIKIADKYELDKSDYEYKLENLLSNIALGMVPNTDWDGAIRAHGGYIIVRDDGELVGYHAYNADVFRKYLLNNTKLDTPSSLRHQFGILYKEDGKIFIKLNLQIRFIK